jgi:hypothetical protein
VRAKLCNSVSDDIQVGYMLGFIGKQLEKACIVDGVIIIVAGVYVQR